MSKNLEIIILNINKKGVGFMNEKKIKVKVLWQGNKAQNLPAGLQYITVAKFDEDWEKDAWSIVLEFEKSPSAQGNPSLGYAKFLMPNAPKEKLSPGAEFELYEGKSLVAKIQVN